MSADAFRHFRWADQVIARRDLTSAAKIVAYRLARHANAKTERCCPSQKTLAGETGLSPRTVSEAISLLRRIGALDVTHGRGNRANYRLLEMRAETRNSGASYARGRATDAHEAADPDAHVGAYPTGNYEVGTTNGTSPRKRTTPNPEKKELSPSAVRGSDGDFSFSDHERPPAAEQEQLDRLAEGLVRAHARLVENETGKAPRVTGKTYAAARDIAAAARGDRKLILDVESWARDRPYYGNRVLKLERFARSWPDLVRAYHADRAEEARRENRHSERIEREREMRGIECPVCEQRYLPAEVDESGICNSCLHFLAKKRNQAYAEAHGGERDGESS